jgi:DNA-binding LytR/AlgR family response regulator
MIPYKAISIDDESSAHDALSVLLNDVPDVELTRTFTSPVLALSALQNDHYDLLFLDIAMPEVGGLDILRALRQTPVTVLLTARVEHALLAFELGVRDYLLKPLSAERLYRCLEHLRPLLQAAKAAAPNRAPARLSIKCGTAHRLIDPAAIQRIEAAGNFSVVHTIGEEIFASETIKELERRLAPFDFMRIHKSHLVNTSVISSICAAGLTLRNGFVLPIGRAYRLAVSDTLRTVSFDRSNR